MPSIQNTQPMMPEYNVAGYKAGDAIGAGVVVDPRNSDAYGVDDVKMVTIDYNMNGKKDANEQLTLMVKLPKEGFIPQDWKGPSAKSQDNIGGYLGGALTGGFLGAVGGFLGGMGAGAAAEAGVLGAKLASGAGPLRVAIGVGVAVAATGAVIGARMNTSESRVLVQNDAIKARNASVPDVIPPKQVLNIPSYN